MRIYKIFVYMVEQIKKLISKSFFRGSDNKILTNKELVQEVPDSGVTRSDGNIYAVKEEYKTNGSKYEEKRAVTAECLKQIGTSVLGSSSGSGSRKQIMLGYNNYAPGKLTAPVSATKTERESTSNGYLERLLSNSAYYYKSSDNSSTYNNITISLGKAGMEYDRYFTNGKTSLDIKIKGFERIVTSSNKPTTLNNYNITGYPIRSQRYATTSGLSSNNDISGTITKNSNGNIDFNLKVLNKEQWFLSAPSDTSYSTININDIDTVNINNTESCNVVYVEGDSNLEIIIYI